MSPFLRAKHWQLFLVTFGIPIVLEIVFMINIFAKIAAHPNPDPAEIFKFMRFFPVIMLCFMVALYGWQWSVAIGLQHKIPEGVQMKVKKFKLFFFFPIVYISIFLLVIAGLFLSLSNGSEPNPAAFVGVFVVIFPLHLFAMFCSFYSLYFVAKTIKTVELQREVSFSDFAGEFFLIWFFPIGVWIIQPKINKLIEG